MSLLEEYEIGCPSCGEIVTVVIDKSILQQQYTEDCFVCCRPMIINVNFNNEYNEISCFSETEIL